LSGIRIDLLDSNRRRAGARTCGNAYPLALGSFAILSGSQIACTCTFTAKDAPGLFS